MMTFSPSSERSLCFCPIAVAPSAVGLLLNDTALKAHQYKTGLVGSGVCECGYGIEDSPHFFFECSIYESSQHILESELACHQRLRSSSRHHLVVPRHRHSMLGRRAFSVASPMAWNALPDNLRDPSLSADNFSKRLKTHLFRNALGQWTLSALEALRNALYKFKTYLLTYIRLNSFKLNSLHYLLTEL